LKEIGDGFLVSFGSVSDAVNCSGAIISEIQSIKDLNLRIGIHLGDVVEENGENYGDGINIASRIQGIANVNEILVSEVIYNDIRNKEGITAIGLGENELKNISEPVKTYSIQFDKEYCFTDQLPRKKSNHTLYLIISLIVVALLISVLIIWSATDSSDKLQPNNPQISSIAILPFDNLTGDESQEPIIAGLHDNLITRLAQIGKFDVISRASTLLYTEKGGKTISQIAGELGVDGIVEASVLKADDSLRINVQFIQAFPEERHLWQNLYDTKFENILGLFDEITESVASEISTTVDKNGSSKRVILNDPEAIKAYLKGMFYMENPQIPGNIETATNYFERAINLDSSFAQPYSGLAFVWIVKYQFRMATTGEAMPKIFNYLNQAEKLNPDLPNLHYYRALSICQLEWDWENGEYEFKNALEVNPNHALAHAFYGHVLMFLQRWDEAVEHMESACELDPLNPFLRGLQNVVLWHKGDFDSIVTGYMYNPKVFPQDAVDESMAYLSGDIESSFEMLEKFHSNSIEFNQVSELYQEEGYYKAVGLLASLLEDTMASSVGIAVYYVRAKQLDDAIRVLENGYKMHDPDLPYAFVPIELEVLESDPRYQALAKKINLPY
jgi:TolB-like protein